MSKKVEIKMTRGNKTELFKEVPASEILENIRNGVPIKYDHVKIIGDINISNLELPVNDGTYIVAPEIEIVSSIFEGLIRFSECEYKENLNLSNTIFNQSTYFQGSKFKKNINFTSCDFRKSTYFDKCKCCGRASFPNVNFGGLSLFDKSYFKKDASFNYARFNEDVTFERSEFLENAEFSRSTFNEKAIFNGIKFKKGANYRLCNFKGFTSFNSCFFKEHLDLEGSNCFTIFFNDVVFKKESSLKLKYSVFSRLEARWSIIHDKLDYDESAYMALIRNYNNLGWFDDADECNYQYRTERRWELQGIKWFIDLIPWLIFGYGVRIYFPLAWMTVIYIISAIIYWTIDQVQFLDALKLSAIILKTTTQVGNLVGLYWFVSIMERILGWLLMSAFLVSLAKKTLR